ncbi:MAG: hypothetical protein AB7P69_03805 [Candidatus Binatia bacterium]
MHGRIFDVKVRLMVCGAIALLALFVSLVRAEDPSAIVAALQDPDAECRYLRQKWLEAKAATVSKVAVESVGHCK